MGDQLFIIIVCLCLFLCFFSEIFHCHCLFTSFFFSCSWKILLTNIKVKNKTSPTDSRHSSDCDTDLENLDIHHRVAEACPKSKFAGLMVISWPTQQLSATKLTCIVYIYIYYPKWPLLFDRWLHPTNCILLKDVHRFFSCFPCDVCSKSYFQFVSFFPHERKPSLEAFPTNLHDIPVPQLGIGGQHQVLEVGSQTTGEWAPNHLDLVDFVWWKSMGFHVTI